MQIEDTLQASLDMEDPLYQQKRAIVQKNNRLTIQTFQVIFYIVM